MLVNLFPDQYLAETSWLVQALGGRPAAANLRVYADDPLAKQFLRVCLPDRDYEFTIINTSGDGTEEEQRQFFVFKLKNV